jgi:hypothetical protein
MNRAPARDLPVVAGQGGLAARRLRWLDAAIRKYGLEFDPETIAFLNTTYRTHVKLDLDQNTIKEVADLSKKTRTGDLLARRAAQGELNTLKLLNDDPRVGRIRMIKQTNKTRTPDFEVMMKGGTHAGELRQVEVRTLTRTGWKAGKRIDKLLTKLRASAARFAAYAKLRRSRMPRHVIDGPVDSDYLYKTQVYARGYVSVQVAGDMADDLPLSPRDIELLSASLSRHGPKSMTDASGVTHHFENGEIANIEGVWVHYVSNGVRKVQMVMNPDIN